MFRTMAVWFDYLVTSSSFPFAGSTRRSGIMYINITHAGVQRRQIMFSDLFENKNGLCSESDIEDEHSLRREIEVRYLCPLMRLMSMTIIPDDYTGHFGPFWIFERLDEICEAMGLPDHCLDTPLQRIVVAAMLEEVYTPFAIYLIDGTDSYKRQRGARYTATIYWDTLHKFLCANGGGKFEDRLTIDRFVNLVNQFIQEHPVWDRSTAEWTAASVRYFGKHAGGYGELYERHTTTAPKYAAKWLERARNY